MHALDHVWETIRREFDASCAQIARAARCQQTNELNQLLRRFRNYQNEAEWISVLLDGTARFAKQAAIFSVQNDECRLRAQVNLSLPSELSFPVKSAGAFASAVETHDPVIALRTASEVTSHLSSTDRAERAHIVPVMNRKRTVAVVFAADQEYMDVNALELIAGLASTVLERELNTALHAQIAPAKVDIAKGMKKGESETVVAPSPPSLPSWTELSENQRTLHLRAQRFSRVKVAEIQLANPDACRAGREQNNLYLFLKPQIDNARESYRKQFMTIPSMVDYLHLELVSTAAEGDEMKLGAEYPGQLV